MIQKMFTLLFILFSLATLPRTFAQSADDASASGAGGTGDDNVVANNWGVTTKTDYDDKGNRIRMTVTDLSTGVVKTIIFPEPKKP